MRRLLAIAAVLLAVTSAAVGATITPTEPVAPLTLTGPLLAGAPPSPPSPHQVTVKAATRSYPWHTNIVATTFWVGERFNDNLADGSQTCSAYDGQWAKHWSGVDNGQKEGSKTDCAGAALGGCDGVWHGTKCGTEVRKAPDFWPSQAKPKENPFYLDLPFDDVNDATALKTRCAVIPWANDGGKCTSDPKVSLMKNRWVRMIGPSGHPCFGQIEDAGPSSGSRYHDSKYVFGANDARPANKKYGRAGLDVSPALNGCLGFKELDGDTDHIRWQFVDDADVPAGPWTKVITKSGFTP
jgi:hypothetical protein